MPYAKKEYRQAASKLYRELNPDKVKKQKEQWRKSNSAAVADKKRNQGLMSKYGLTSEQYDEMSKAQGGRCAICNRPPTPTRRLAVDHCHKTGKIRALLCHVCNNHLGIFERQMDVFTAYISRFSDD
jgi:hypothetical protein